MYTFKADKSSFIEFNILEEYSDAEYMAGIDISRVFGDLDPCMQSPECTDHSNPPAGH